MGNGEQRSFGDGSPGSVTALGAVIRTVAGAGPWTRNGSVYSGDGGPALDAYLTDPADVAVAADGTFFIADLINDAVRKVTPDGIITTFAQGHLPNGVDVAADGSVIVSYSDEPTVVVYAPDGTVKLSYGPPPFGICDSQIDDACGATGVAAGPDCTYFFIENGGTLLKRIAPDATVHVSAGTGVRGHSGDGGPATQGDISVQAIALGPDGALYFTESGYVRRVDPGGTLTTVAGNGSVIQSGDGGPALVAGLAAQGIDVARDGTIYLSTVGDFTNLTGGLSGRPGACGPGLPRIRTGPIKASGSSRHGFATQP